jgi:hypothetical protein
MSKKTHDRTTHGVGSTRHVRALTRFGLRSAVAFTLALGTAFTAPIQPCSITNLGYCRAALVGLNPPFVRVTRGNGKVVCTTGLLDVPCLSYARLLKITQ